jgi:ligand-binding SRPBCC domain-containing protein
MGFYQLKKSQQIPATISEVWDFVSNPVNLKEITPKYMGFDILTKDLPAQIYQGMIIQYHVKPVLGIKTLWVTEITQVSHQKYFVDEQRIGPYKIWHHQHLLKENSEGVLMEDIISYQPPFGLIGSIANKLFIEKQLTAVFDYRTVAVEKIFGKPSL